MSTNPNRARISRARSPFVLFRKTKLYRGRTVLMRPWYVRFTGHGPDGARKQIKIALRTEDKAEAEKLAWEHYSEKAAPAASGVRDPLLGPLFHEYRGHMRATADPKTASERWYVLRRFLKQAVPSQNRLRLSSITTRIINRYVQRRRLEDGISPWTTKEIKKSLSALFTFARENYGFRGNPVSGVQCPRTDLAPIDYLKLAQIPAVLDAVRKADPIILRPVATAIFAGLRRSEIAWLTPADVALDKQIIWICRKARKHERYQTKTGTSRVVPISQELLSFLQGYAPGHDWFFPTVKTRRWNGDFLGRRLRLVMRAHGWRHTFGTFRHTFGSQLAQGGMSLYKISHLMGNSEEVCRQHYAALCPSEMQEEVSFMKGSSSAAARSSAPPSCDQRAASL